MSSWAVYIMGNIHGNEKMQKGSSNSTTWDTSTYHYVSKLKGCRLRGCSNLLHHIFDKNTFCIIYHKKDQSISFNFCKDNAQKANIWIFILSPRGIKLIYCTPNQLDQDIHIIIYCSLNFISLCPPSAKKMNGYCCLTKRPTDRKTEAKHFLTPASERGYTALPLCAGLSDVCLSVTNDILLSNY